MRSGNKIARMSRTGRIYLTGMMGSGKTTLGRRAANVLSRSFVDLDDLIELEAGLSVPEIFATLGEEVFRRIESEVLRAHSDSTNVIIALGGGTLLDEANQKFVLQSGTLVYLSLSEKMLTQRLRSAAAASRRKRPLLLNTLLLTDQDCGPDAATFDEHIQRLRKARLPGYECARLKVDVGGCSEKTALTRLLDSISAMGE